MRPKFGFLRGVEHVGDVFFHYAALEGVSKDALQPGDEVEFSVSRDGPGRRLHAVRCGRFGFQVCSRDLGLMGLEIGK